MCYILLNIIFKQNFIVFLKQEFMSSFVLKFLKIKSDAFDSVSLDCIALFICSLKCRIRIDIHLLIAGFGPNLRDHWRVFHGRNI